jgi:hypothetical protein
MPPVKMIVPGEWWDSYIYVRHSTYLGAMVRSVLSTDSSL